jgi:Ras-related GTP-binding protein A/B
VLNSKFTAFIEGFTNNTYLLVVVSDKEIENSIVYLNIRIAKKYFENFINKQTESNKEVIL